ncbi:MAG: 2Fe-2S iron-sulfur cluster-binding protein [Panacagrimonas sp.]
MPDGGAAIAERLKLRLKVSLRQTGESYTCDEGETLLQGMIRLGRKGIPVGCVNGGCGVCKVKVHGQCRSAGAVSRDHVSADEASDGITLACRVIPESDVEVEVLGKMQKSFLGQFGRIRNGS